MLCRLLLPLLVVLAAAAAAAPVEHRLFIGSREYYLYVPESYTGRVAVPLVVKLHGMGVGETCKGRIPLIEFVKFMNQSNVKPFLLLAPCGLAKEMISEYYTTPVVAFQWNWDDREYIEATIAAVKSSYRVNKVYGVGYSNGGGMIEYLTCHYPAMFDEVVSRSGYLFTRGNYTHQNTPNYKLVTECNAAYAAANHKIPILRIHNIHDVVVPYYGKFAKVSAHDDFMLWGERNGCKGPALVLEDSAVLRDERYTALQCEGRAAVRLVTVKLNEDSINHLWTTTKEYNDSEFILRHLGLISSSWWWF